MPSVVEDLSWIKGSHQFGFGGAIYQQRLNYWSGVNGVGTATFDGSTTGLILGDFLVGRPVTFNQGTAYGFYTRQFYDSLYAQDSWKMTSAIDIELRLAMGTVFGALQQSRRELAFRSLAVHSERSQQSIRERPSGVGFSGRTAVYERKIH